MAIPVFANVDRRIALAVPTDRSQVWTQNVAILAVSLLSLLGAGWMILSFFVRWPVMLTHVMLTRSSVLPKSKIISSPAYPVS
jgi:hypothetical protein